MALIDWRNITERYGGVQASVEVPAGKTFVVEVSPAGEEVLVEETPAGKRRTYTITITAREVVV